MFSCTHRGKEKMDTFLHLSQACFRVCERVGSLGGYQKYFTVSQIVSSLEADWENKLNNADKCHNTHTIQSFYQEREFKEFKNKREQSRVSFWKREWDTMKKLVVMMPQSRINI